MSIENKTYYDWQRRRFGSPVDMTDEHGDIGTPAPLDPEIIQMYGSRSRYNQLQNHPYNTTMGVPAIPGYNTEEYIEQLMDGRENNIMDMDAVRNIGQNNLSLNDILANQFGSVTRRNQLQNYPYNTIDYVSPEEARQITPNNIDDVTFYMTNGNPPPKDQKKMRPVVMTYDEYEKQYMPYQYAERMQNQMRDNYDNYIQGINLDEYLDRLE